MKALDIGQSQDDRHATGNYSGLPTCSEVSTPEMLSHMTRSLPLLVVGLALLAGACQSASYRQYHQFAEHRIFRKCVTNLKLNRGMLTTLHLVGDYDNSKIAPAENIRLKHHPVQGGSSNKNSPTTEELTIKLKSCYKKERESGAYDSYTPAGSLRR